MSDKHFIGLDLTGLEDNGLRPGISRVTLLLDGENAVTAGDGTGAELTANCPHATQAMAEAILAQAQGYQYRMFSATDAALDPAAELGRPALPIWMLAWSVLPTWPMVALQFSRTRRTSPEGRRT